MDNRSRRGNRGDVAEAGHMGDRHGGGDRGDAAEADPDAVVRDTAARQHGVVSRAQLLAAGVSPRTIEYRLQQGRLRTLHRGVYRVGPLSGRYERETAALLACGDSAVLSHRTAAGLWELAGEEPRAPIHVTVRRSLRGPDRGVVLHRVSRLDPAEVDRRHGLPITTPGRTLLDLASCTHAHEVERMLATGERSGILRLDHLEALLSRHSGRRGIRSIRNLLTMSGSPALTRSRAEARFLALVRKGEIPRPLTNVRVEGLEVDFLWQERGLVVEIDGFAYHSGRRAFERDRRRDAILAAAGFHAIRFTWRQLTERPEVVLVQLAQALARGEPLTSRGPGR